MMGKAATWALGTLRAILKTSKQMESMITDSLAGGTAGSTLAFKGMPVNPGGGLLGGAANPGGGGGTPFWETLNGNVLLNPGRTNTHHLSQNAPS